MINVNITLAMAGVVAGFFIFLIIVKPVIITAMKNYYSIILVGVMTFVERLVSTSAIISQRVEPLIQYN